MSRSLLLVLALGVVSAAHAHDVPAASGDMPPDLTLDVEIDPLAYGLGGHSVHGGLRVGALRFDLGAFALDVPESFHGQTGFELYFSGFGVKLDYRPFTRLRGLFFGLQVNLVRESVRHIASNITETQQALLGGPRVGYQIDLGAGLYLTPWIGLEVALTDRDLEISGDTYAPGRVVPFPTVHLGYVL